MGVFSRLYQFDPVLCVVYHAPSQTVALLEGDSAEVWERVFSAKGNTSAAHAYILQNGQFQGDPCEESLQILDAFGDQLSASHLLMDDASASVQPDVPSSVFAPASVEDVLNNPEHMVGQIMADHHVLYDLTLELTHRCNEKCVHCYLPGADAPRELSVAQIDKLLGEFAEVGGMRIYLTGGEIMVRKDFREILEAVRSHRLVTRSLTPNPATSQKST